MYKAVQDKIVLLLNLDDVNTKNENDEELPPDQREAVQMLVKNTDRIPVRSPFFGSNCF